MASSESPSFSKICRLLVVIVCLVRTAPGLEPQEKATKSPAKPNEDSVFKDLLKVVEKNFDKLTTRITALENTLSSMQFYSIRQFNQISGNLQTTNNDLGTVRKQVSQIEIDGRSQKIALSLLGRDVTELKKSSSDVLGELESSMVHVNENMDKHNDLMRAVIEETLVKTARETTSQMSKHMDEVVLRIVRAQPEPVNCSLSLADVSSHVDVRFAELKKQANTHFVKLLTATKMDQKKNVCVREPGQENNASTEKVDDKLCNCRNGPDKIGKSRETVTSNIVIGAENITRDENIKTENITNYLGRLENITNNFNRSENITNHIPGDENKEYRDEEDQRVMNALYNMTRSVLQAVSFFRNTGAMLEQILSNTDSLVIEQADISRRLGSMEGREQTTSVKADNETSNVILGSHYQKRQQVLKKMFSDSQSTEVLSDVPVAVVDNVARFIKNGSQLLEVLTDLAQVCSVSLSKVTVDLQDEVKRIDELRTQMATSLLAKEVEDESSSIKHLYNTTQKTFKLVESLASNAGWIPLIFQNVHHLESLTNRSLQIVTQNHKMLSNVQQIVTFQDSTQDGDQRENYSRLGNIIPQTFSEMEGLLYNDVNASSKQEVHWQKEALETANSTSSKLSGTSTLLNKLLLARDHALRIVSSNGSTDVTEGRLEIFHMGVWQLVCADGWTVTSASVACQQLGFSSGKALNVAEWVVEGNTRWLGNTACTGLETRLDACPNGVWTDSCSGLSPAGVSCL